MQGEPGSGGYARVMTTEHRSTVRIAAMSDVHYGKSSQGHLADVFAQAADMADLLVLCGDLTDYGLADEARVLAKDLVANVRVPIVGVLGNHDYEAGEEDTIRQIMTDAGARILDGDAVEIHGIGFAGAKGFAGGFGRGALGPWGEATIKQFVHEAIQEALKLENALARLRSAQRIALLHYSPVRSTCEGEPPEILAYLGSSRLEEPLGRFPVTAVFHGHAHKGAPEGRTQQGVPVFNVSLALLRDAYPDRPPFRLLEVKRTSESDGEEVAIGSVTSATPRRRSGDA